MKHIFNKFCRIFGQTPSDMARKSRKVKKGQIIGGSFLAAMKKFITGDTETTLFNGLPDGYVQTQASTKVIFYGGGSAAKVTSANSRGTANKRNSPQK